VKIPRTQSNRSELASLTILVVLMITLPSCDFLELSDIRPRKERLSFRRMEVQYKLSWPFSDITYTTEIEPTGLVRAQMIGGGLYGQTVLFDAGAYLLSNEERTRLEKLFYGFEPYKRLYTSDAIDGKYHHVILIYEGKPDTVTVYEPWSGELPRGLSEILTEMQRIQEKAFAYSKK